MTDIEKVTKGLECHKNGLCQIDDKTSCPYWECEKDCSKHLMADALELLKAQQAEIKRLTLSGEWKRMSDLPIETDDRFECSICGNVVHYHDRINLYTFNDYCGRCGAYNGFKFKDGEQE